MLTKATKIYAANVRGLVKNLKVIHTLNLETYDVLLFSEIWSIKEYENVVINSFELKTKYQRDSRGGGVAIFTKKGLKTDTLNPVVNNGITEAVGIRLAIYFQSRG